MTKPDVTLQPSKGIISEAAARIYAAYIIAGHVKEDNAEVWIKRAIRESIAIARMVDASVYSDNELPANGPTVIRPHLETIEPSKLKQKPIKKQKEKSIRESDNIEQLAEEVLMDEDSKEEAADLIPFEEEESPKMGKQAAPAKSSSDSEDPTDSDDDASQIAEEALRRMTKTASRYGPKPNNAS